MFIRYNVFTIFWMVIILLLTLTPGENMPSTSLWDELLSLDKIAHLFIFSVLVFLMIVGLSKQYAYVYLRKYALKISVITGIVYGIIIEIIQQFIPGRSFELADIVADSVGCLIGLGLFFIVYKF